MKAKMGPEPTMLNFNHYMTLCSDKNLNQIVTFLQNTGTLLSIELLTSADRPSARPHSNNRTITPDNRPVTTR